MKYLNAHGRNVYTFERQTPDLDKSDLISNCSVGYFWEKIKYKNLLPLIK